MSSSSLEVITRENESDERAARRLYSMLFGKLLDDADETPSLICDRLYLGSILDAQDIEKLKRNKIKYVLNMTGLSLYPDNFFAASGLEDMHILLINAHDDDNYDISGDFPVALNFIHRSLRLRDGSVLVHCAAGVSRSPTIVAAYLMVKDRISAMKAILQVNQARPCVCPNIGFLRKLIQFEKKDLKFD